MCAFHLSVLPQLNIFLMLVKESVNFTCVSVPSDVWGPFLLPP